MSKRLPATATKKPAVATSSASKSGNGATTSARKAPASARKRDDQLDPLVELENRLHSQGLRGQLRGAEGLAAYKEEQITDELAVIDARMLRRNETAEEKQEEIDEFAAEKLQEFLQVTARMAEAIARELKPKYQDLDKLSKEQKVDQERKTKLREKLISVKKNAASEKAWLQYDLEKDGQTAATITPDGEMQKFLADPSYIPQLPVKGWNAWDKVLGKFLEIIRNYFCEEVTDEEKYPENLSQWKTGKYSTQQMLKDHLVPFIEQHAASIIELGAFKAGKLSEFLTAINNERNEIFCPHFTAGSAPPLSYYTPIYAGVIKTIDALKRAGVQKAAGPSAPEIELEPESASDHEIVVRRSMGRVLESMSECIRKTFENPMAPAPPDV